VSETRAREIAVRLRQLQQKHLRKHTRGALDDGGRLKLGAGQKSGVLPAEHGGTGNDQGAGPHPLVGALHTAAGLTTGDVLTATGATTYAFAPPPPFAGSAWSVLTNGDPADPQLVWDSFGDVIMTEVPR
jgi:hypothetical protein